jgi:hypothetical protein
MANDQKLEQLARDYLAFGDQQEVTASKLKARMRELGLCEAYIFAIPARVELQDSEGGLTWVERLEDAEGDQS